MDTPSLVVNLYRKTGIWPRSLGEHAWFALPGVKEFVQHLAGVVDGTPENCALIMEKGQNLLVYPGGARESWKCGPRTTCTSSRPEVHVVLGPHIAPA